MDKQRMSNILSSVQMSPRDRKDFIEELSKLGQGEQGGGENNTDTGLIDITLTDNAESNLSTIENLDLTKSYIARLILENVNIIGTYYNSTFIGFNEAKIVRYDIDSEGNITQDLSINPELIGTVAKLEVGDADDICQRNLELINMAITQAGANHFDVDIDYGVGSATFTQGLADDAIAGTATIIVATGYVTKYNLYGNGKVEKVGNDIDLFALEARIAALEGA